MPKEIKRDYGIGITLTRVKYLIIPGIIILGAISLFSGNDEIKSYEIEEPTNIIQTVQHPEPEETFQSNFYHPDELVDEVTKPNEVQDGTIENRVMCNQDLDCEINTSCLNGVCTAPQESGAYCEFGNHCKEGTVCISNVCETLRKESEECEDHRICIESLTCVDHKCAEPLPERSGCRNSFECEYACDPVNKTCTGGKSGEWCGDKPDTCISDHCSDDRFCLKDEGESCNSSAECAYSCKLVTCTGGEIGDYCNEDWECKEGSCLGEYCQEESYFESRDMGERCSTPDHCQEGLNCISGFCSEDRLKEDEECDVYRNEGGCEEGFLCIFDKCSLPLAEGEPCELNLGFNRLNPCDEGMGCKQALDYSGNIGICKLVED